MCKSSQNVWQTSLLVELTRIVLPHLCQLLMIMWQPTSNSFFPYMTSHTKNIISIICVINYSLNKTLTEKSYHQHSVPYYSTFSEQIVNFMLGKVLVPPFWNYPVLSEMDGWRAKKSWSKKKQFEMLYQTPFLS